MISNQISSFKKFLLAILTIVAFQTSKAQTVLNPGDMAIIGLNYDVTPHELTIVNFVPISAGTTIRITDYAYDSGTGLFAATSLTNTNEGSIAWTTTGAIAANTVFKIAITVTSGPSVSGLPGTIGITGWSNPVPGTCPSAAGGDNWFIFQGSSATSVSNWVFGWTNPFAVTHNSIPQVIGQFLVAGSGMPNIGNTYLPPGLTLGLNAIALNYDPGSGGYHGDNNVYTGIKCGTQTTVLNAICNTANWLTSETTTYNIDPGGTYFPGVNPIFCVTAPCPTPTLSFIAKNNVLCNGGSTGSATMSATGGGPFTYTWSPSGGSSNVATGLSAGIYTCATTNSCGSTATQTVNITQPTAVAASTAITNPLCNGANGSATITLSGGTSPYTYTWSSGPTSSVEPTLLAGTYTVRGTDANGCSITRSVTITQPSAIVTSTNLTNVACFGNSTGSATVTASGGAGGYTYLWSTGATTSVITGQNAGVKTVTVTDANSCTRVTSVTITQPASAVNTSTAITNVLCFGNSTGAATVTASGGTAGYTYMWSTGATTSVITGQVSGVRTVTVSDANGCTRVATVTISQPASAVSTSTAAVNVLCFGNSTGAATVTASGGTGGYTYLWSTGATTSVITGQNAGVKTVTVTDANGCTSIKSVNITQPASALNTSTTITNVLCFGNSTGAATVTASGGTAGYTYLWSSAQTTSVITGLNAGVRTVTVTDANSCVSVNTVTISQPVSAISVSVSSTTAPGCGLSNGAITISANGGTGTLTYSWSPTGGSSSTASGLGAGSYTCFIADANSCLTNISQSLSNPNSPSVAATSTNAGCAGQTNGNIVLNVSGGTPGYTYSWSPSVSTTSIASALGAGVYNATVTDASNCKASQSFTLTAFPLPTVTANSFSAACNGNTGCISAGGANTYSWVGPCGFTSVQQNPCFPFNIACSCAYTVTGTDLNGCANTATICLNISPDPTVTVNTSNTLICVGQSATLTANGASTYSWNPGGAGTSISVSPTVTSTYSVTGTSSVGCSNTATFTQSVSTCAGIQELGSESEELFVYPNPNNGKITIEINKQNEEGSIVITNALGQEVYKTIVTDIKTNIDLSNQTNGIYFVQIIGNGKTTLTKKIVKQ